MISGGPPEVAEDLVEVQGSANQKRAEPFCVLLQNPLERRRVFRPWCAAIVAGATHRRRKKQRIGLIFCGSLERKRARQGLPGLCLGHRCPQSPELLIAG
ncbi:hypothetical protein AAC387_Pa02g0336 [Persea americana]